MPSWDILIFLLITAVSVIGGFVQKGMDKKNKAARKSAIASQSKTSRAEKSQAEYKKFRTAVIDKMASKSPGKKRTQVRAGGPSSAVPKVAASIKPSVSGVQVPRPQSRPLVKLAKPAKAPVLGSSRKKAFTASQSPVAAPVAISAEVNETDSVMAAPSGDGAYSKDQGAIGHRIHKRLSNSQSLADAILLAEIISPPRSLREYGMEQGQ